MKLHLDCVPCFLRQALQAARFASLEAQAQERTLRRVMEELEGSDWTSSPAAIAYRVHRIVREESGNHDPYREAKRRSNDAALALYPELRERVAASADPVATALRLAIAGNVIDFAARPDYDLQAAVSDVLERPPAIDDSPRLLEELSRARSLACIADNAGEIVFDRLLLETVVARFGLSRLLFAVKSAPFINDATMEDARHAGLDRLPGLEFLEVAVGSSEAGLEWGGPEFLHAVRGEDVVISKGQANYEAFGHERGIFFLLMVKCTVVAEDLGVGIGETVIKGPLD